MPPSSVGGLDQLGPAPLRMADSGETAAGVADETPKVGRSTSTRDEGGTGFLRRWAWLSEVAAGSTNENDWSAVETERRDCRRRRRSEGEPE